MKLKSYFAGTVEAAIAQARQELGDDALLVNTRRAMPEARHLGDYEVVFASAPRPERPAGPEAPADAEGWKRVSNEVADLRRQLEKTAAMLARAGTPARYPFRSGRPAVELAAALVSRDLAPEVAEDIGEAAAEAVSRGAVPPDPASLAAFAAGELARRIPLDPSLGREGRPRRVAALAGPPGAGKTTAIVKLAAVYGLAARRPAQILSMDNVRIAAAEQLRVYAGILGIGFQMIETPTALAQALEEHRHKDLILIDTPGYGPRDMDAAAELARALSSHPEADVHLVLSAARKSADLLHAVERFEVFRPRKIVFTRLDETDAAGTAISAAIESGLPISFLSDGQQIPEDLRPASAEYLADLLLGERPSVRAVAA
mgnify:CR=1 FL=1